MKAETAAALIELVRAATKHVTGKEPEGPITVTICRDREYEWCGLTDDYAEVTEEDLTFDRQSRFLDNDLNEQPSFQALPGLQHPDTGAERPSPSEHA